MKNKLLPALFLVILVIFVYSDEACCPVSDDSAMQNYAKLKDSLLEKGVKDIDAYPRLKPFLNSISSIIFINPSKDSFVPSIFDPLADLQ